MSNLRWMHFSPEKWIEMPSKERFRGQAHLAITNKIRSITIVGYKNGLKDSTQFNSESIWFETKSKVGINGMYRSVTVKDICRPLIKLKTGQIQDRKHFEILGSKHSL